MVVKSVVTIWLEAVPPGAETVEQLAEQNPRRESRRSVSTSSVPQSVPLDTPRKPLQGLAVPQFHDFGRIGEKNTKNRSAHIPGKRAPHVCPTSPVCASIGAGGLRPQLGENPPTKPASRPVCGRERQRSDGERRSGQKEEKLRFFSPIPAEYRRIYSVAGISLAVTSARNSGPRRRKTASLRGFGGS